MSLAVSSPSDYHELEKENNLLKQQYAELNNKYKEQLVLNESLNVKFTKLNNDYRLMCTAYIKHEKDFSAKREEFNTLQAFANDSFTQNELLIEELKKKSEEVLELPKLKEEHANMLKTTTKIKNVGTSFYNKIMGSISLMNTIKQYLNPELITENSCEWGGLYGSVLRHLFELPFSLKEEFKTTGYGDPQGTDCNILLFKNIVTRNELKNNIHDFFVNMYNYVNVWKCAMDKVEPFKLDNLIVFNVADGPDKSINSYVIKAYDENKNIVTFNIIGWMPSYYSMNGMPDNTYDFDVNSLIMSEQGIKYGYGTYYSERNKLNMFSTIINNIAKKEADCLIDVIKYQKVLTEHRLRNERQSALLSFASFMSSKMEIITRGYKIVSQFDIPKVSIEEKEDCLISACQAPYMNVHLICDHKISLMSYIGCVKSQTSPYVDTYLCPYCRENLLVNIETSKPTPMNISSMKLEKNQLKLKNEVTDAQCFSNESNEFIANLMSRVTNNRDQQQLNSAQPSPRNV
jgi:hypothetical protein